MCACHRYIPDTLLVLEQLLLSECGVGSLALGAIAADLQGLDQNGKKDWR